MRTGSVCTGYGGLDMAVHEVLGGELAWVADIDPGANAILASRFPSVPNLGDISVADWSAVEPVDVIVGGFPCTDVSCAGQRAGLREGTRSGVWTHMARAIGALRPSLVVIENVRGLLTARGDEPTDEHLKAEADRDTILRLGLPQWLETERRIAVAKGDWNRARRCQVRANRIMGLRRRAVARCQWHERRLVRAIGTVLGDLADIGFDAEWTVVSAAESGAPHKRERVFIIAWPAVNAESVGRGLDRGRGRQGGQGEQRGLGTAERGARTTADAEGSGWDELDDGSEPGAHGSASLIRHARLAGDDRGGRFAAEDADRAAGGERRLAAPGQAAGGRPRSHAGGPGGIRAAADTDRPGREGAEPARRQLMPAWGAYELAVRRWERVIGQPAPRPTEPGRTGERLSPRFVEWMMGLPEGWVTGIPGLPRNAQLKALGNGVVPQQAAMALRVLLERAAITPLVAAEGAA